MPMFGPTTKIFGFTPSHDQKLALRKNYGIVEVQQPYEMLAGLLEVHDLKAILFSESGEILASSVQEDNEMKLNETCNFKQSFNRI